MAYKLELQPSFQVHPIFHASLLRPAKGAFSNSTPLLPINSNWNLMGEPDRVLAHCWNHNTSIPTLELLIQRQHRPAQETSWEVYDLLTEQFPSFHLEDKVNFQGRSTNTVPHMKTYFRIRACVKKVGEAEIYHMAFDLAQDPVKRLVVKIYRGVISG